MSAVSVRWRQWVPAAAICGAVALSFPSLAFAEWSAGGAGAADAAALGMPAGTTPTASASGNRVTVSWSAVTFATGAPVAGYVVNRYSTAGVLQTIGSGCSGVITTTTCTEIAVPNGTWTYTETPVQFSWTGAASSQSNSVVVAA